jgi:dihydroflavonol-4-reductase
MEAKGQVLVTGATGYIAAYVIQELLARGYDVVGTVRQLNNQDRYAFLFELPHAKEHLTIREADLLDQAAWGKALEGVQSVIHVASPIPPGLPQDENDLIKPAVEGTQNVIAACLQNKVKRLVFTSSCLTALVRMDGKVVDENDWSDEKLLHFYPKSKYLAEKLFWAEAEKHGNEMEFVSVLPSLVVGPPLSRHGNSSEAFVSDILSGSYPGMPTPAPQYAAVDVRDTALAHVKALEYEGAKGKRYIISGFSLTSDELFSILRVKYEPLGYKIPSNPIDAEGIKKSGHGPSMRTLNFLGKKFQVDNSRGVK